MAGRLRSIENISRVSPFFQDEINESHGQMGGCGTTSFCVTSLGSVSFAISLDTSPLDEYERGCK